MVTHIDSLTQSLYTPEQVQSGEKQAADASGVSMQELMARAGRAVFARLRMQLSAPAKVAVCCGAGNNGGDGFIVARLAQQAGYQVQVFALNPAADDLTAGPATNARMAWRDNAGEERALSELQADDYDLIIDAVMGIGLNRPLEGQLLQWVNAVNDSHTPVIAVDVPTGLNADSGTEMGAAINALHTVTFIVHKRGLLTAKAADHIGHLHLEPLQVAEAFVAKQQALWFREVSASLPELPRRLPTAHKGTFGHVLIVGGNNGMPGAAVLAMMAALRCGAGKVSVACHPKVMPVVASYQPEAMVTGVENEEQLTPLLEKASVVIVGPGLGQDSWAQALWQCALAYDIDKVVDADALNLLTQNRDTKLQRSVMTPHPGEAARLLQQTTAEVQDNRFAAVKALQQGFGGTVLLKGAGTLIDDGQRGWLIDRGSAAMASAGMGDVLSGVIGALLAQGMAATDATRLAAYCHAVAGEQAAKSGTCGTLASDLIPFIRDRLNRAMNRDH
ncbi:bifunctional ADP-dependent NAD(P)H-hydrate dehydratase/NAD(P)H-hydrate epimerase [Idiomarina tyrosinivorans]|uniref:Bifunctional NAD(P)H-hydrate repair enzyme n=1 Tax=Idiomarina tyrosinivorans TaxID=1445662 RepID=A0A432ZQT2_9GAMM|nr:NAD(P)H-hydrate dehydratase [Idiomarina tyrosinivorans]RUO80186.1 bifunctional ADP-dependent NAD(P)H-hydrate dehydratase/NAD(P)H-hydrate epimerase [Idiomarina tyrosinivorans]